MTEPVLLIGGGSGMVPLMSMLRAGARGRVLVSARDPDDVLFADELQTPRHGGDPHLHALGAARLDGLRAAASIARCCARWTCPARACTCAARRRSWSRWPNDLVALGHDPATIRTERFG